MGIKKKNVFIAIGDIQLEFPVMVLAYKKRYKCSSSIDIIEVVNKRKTT
jgi:hypothetical protein